MLFKNITRERNDETKMNLKTLKNACGNSIYWSLIQNGHSIFHGREADRRRPIEEHESCIRAIILNFQTWFKHGLKHIRIFNPRGISSAAQLRPYLESLEILFNQVDHLNSIEIIYIDRRRHLFFLQNSLKSKCGLSGF